MVSTGIICLRKKCSKLCCKAVSRPYENRGEVGELAVEANEVEMTACPQQSVDSNL